MRCSHVYDLIVVAVVVVVSIIVVQVFHSLSYPFVIDAVSVHYSYSCCIVVVVVVAAVVVVVVVVAAVASVFIIIIIITIIVVVDVPDTSDLAGVLVIVIASLPN